MDCILNNSTVLRVNILNLKNIHWSPQILILFLGHRGESSLICKETAWDPVIEAFMQENKVSSESWNLYYTSHSNETSSFSFLPS